MPKLKERPVITKKVSVMNSAPQSIYHDVSRFGEEDIYLFKEEEEIRNLLAKAGLKNRR